MNEVLGMKETVQVFLDERERGVADAAARMGVGLRRSLANNGIVQADDFLNGLIIAGITLGKKVAKEDKVKAFTERLKSRAFTYAKLLEEDSFQPMLRAVGEKRTAPVENSPAELLVIAAVSAEDALRELGELNGFSVLECMDAVSLIAVLAIKANVDPLDFEFALEDVLDGLDEKAKIWGGLIPSDEEADGSFGQTIN